MAGGNSIYTLIYVVMAIITAIASVLSMSRMGQGLAVDNSGGGSLSPLNGSELGNSKERASNDHVGINGGVSFYCGYKSSVDRVDLM